MKSSSGAETPPTTSEWKVVVFLAAVGITTTIFCAVSAQGSFAHPQQQWWLAAAWIVLWLRFLWGSWQLLHGLTRPASLFGWSLTAMMSLALLGALAMQTWSAQHWWATYLLLAITYGLALVRYRHEEGRGAIPQHAFRGKRLLDWMGFVGIFLLSLVAVLIPNRESLWIWMFISLQFMGGFVIALRAMKNGSTR